MNDIIEVTGPADGEARALPPRPHWQQRLLHGGRSGLRGFQKDLAAEYSAMLQQGQSFTPAQTRTAMAIANCCGSPSRTRRQAPWKR